MSRTIELLRSRRVPHVALLALTSFAFAGCSADMSTRMSQNGFSNPFASQSEATGSVPAPAIERRELPQYSRPQSQYQSRALQPPIAAPRSSPIVSSGVSGGGHGLASYAPPAHRVETTSTVPARPVVAERVAPHGDIRVIVGTTDTIDILARRYNVSTAAILQANGYRGPRALSPGQQLIIPRSTMAAVVAAPPAASAASSVHVVNPGEGLLSIAHRNHVSLSELARLNGLDPHAKLKVGTKLTVPGARSAAASAPVATAVAVAQPVQTLAPPATKMAALSPIPAQSVRLAQATTKVDEPSVEAPGKVAEATGALPTFRWPVRGKVITSYGAKTNGKSNDGINLAVPEGTPVKAAEDGVVAYSGNELKGYGNLVLIRHANGYVTAYAHASELLVKRGDTIKRGQVIAKSGQSGEVGSPQLHFEIRKGSNPVDPLQFLNGA
jgi:murein DD-endopeptidase MepM/ murein hydrolase activator NlpD